MMFLLHNSSINVSVPMIVRLVLASVSPCSGLDRSGLGRVLDFCYGGLQHEHANAKRNCDMNAAYHLMLLDRRRGQLHKGPVRGRGGLKGLQTSLSFDPYGIEIPSLPFKPIREW